MPSIICRGELTSVSPMRPNSVLVYVAVGISNEGVLVRFDTSARSSRLNRSVMRVFFARLKSRLKYPGPRKKLRPVLPISPAAGADVFAR